MMTIHQLKKRREEREPAFFLFDVFLKSSLIGRNVSSPFFAQRPVASCRSPLSGRSEDMFVNSSVGFSPRRGSDFLLAVSCR